MITEVGILQKFHGRIA